MSNQARIAGAVTPFVIVLICTAVAGCGGERPDLTVSATHKDACVNGKSGVEVLEAKIVNKGSGTVVLAGDETKPWVSARPSLPLPNWATPHPTANTKTLKPGEAVSIPIKVIAPPNPDGAPYNLIIEVDPNKLYAESNEDNNQYLIPVSSAPCQ
jgi:hypothetical protein